MSHLVYGPCIFALLLPPLSKKKLRWAACAGGNYALPTARAAKIRARRQTLKNKYGLRNYLVPSRRTGNETTTLVSRPGRVLDISKLWVTSRRDTRRHRQGAHESCTKWPAIFILAKSREVTRTPTVRL